MYLLDIYYHKLFVLSTPFLKNIPAGIAALIDFIYRNETETDIANTTDINPPGLTRLFSRAGFSCKVTVSS
jgi:hypothetical protein